MVTFPIENSTADAVLARRLAEAAGERLLEIREEGLSGKELKDEGDRQAHELIVAELARLRPQDVVLSEEGADPEARLGADRVWIVDPLDGTKEYGEPGRHDWAVHVALWQQGDLVAGAVAVPAVGITYATDAAPVLPPAHDGPIRLAVSRSRPPAFVVALAQELGGELVPLGSAGYKCASVWRGEADAYVHGGGMYEWDSAAPVAVARSAGLVTARVDGSPLRYNQPDVYLPDLVVARAEVAPGILAWLADHAEQAPAETGR